MFTFPAMTSGCLAACSPCARAQAAVLEAQVAEYDVLKDEHGNIAVDSTGAPLYGDVLLPDVSEFKAVSCCDEAAPAAIGNGIALRHVRTCRGAV